MTTVIDGLILSDELKEVLKGLQKDNSWYGKELIKNIEKMLDLSIMNPEKDPIVNIDTIQELWQCRRLLQVIIEAKGGEA